MRGSTHILYMEDNEGTARLLQKRLSQSGYVIDITPDGEAGLEQSATHIYDMIIVDYNMPGLSGLQVIERLASRDHFPPTIMLTGTGNERVAVEALKLGASDYLVKDIEGVYLDLLPTVIEQCLRHQRLLQDKRRAEEALRDTASVLNGTLELDEVLNRILRNVGHIVPHVSATLMLIAEDHVRIMHKSRGQVIRKETILLQDLLPFDRLLNGKPYILINDTTQFCDTDFFALHENCRSFLSVPIQFAEQQMGYISLWEYEFASYGIEDAENLKMLAYQAALAIHNARLYNTSREVAVLKERNRIAQDLHDAVSQTLWSANIIADTLPRTWRTDFKKAESRLDDLRDLIQHALSEMRTLLMELKPTSILDEGLPDLLRQLTENARSRSGLDINLRIEKDLPPLQFEEQKTIYRITQEALNNTLKHSNATHADVSLTSEENVVYLRVQDNGIGFDAASNLLGTLGLKGMQERAKEIGGQLSVESSRGDGVVISFIIDTNGKTKD